MNYLENNSIKDFVKDIVVDKLYDYEDLSSYGCDLAYTLLESYNIDGVYFYNDYKATEFIKNHFEDLGEIVEEITFELGSDNIPNIFDCPDKFCVVIFLEVASYILGQCKTIEKSWDEELILDKKTIENIINELKEI